MAAACRNHCFTLQFTAAWCLLLPWGTLVPQADVRAAITSNSSYCSYPFYVCGSSLPALAMVQKKNSLRPVRSLAPKNDNELDKCLKTGFSAGSLPFPSNVLGKNLESSQAHLLVPAL